VASAGRPSKDLPPGTLFGELRVIQKVRTPPNSHGGQKYRVQCSCGARMTIPRFYMMRKHNPKKHCGCKAKVADNPYTKRSWFMMHVRCYNPNHVAYHHYGGRGIEVTWDWHKDNPDGWKNFLRDMGPRPEPKDGKVWTLDRKNPNEGYHKDNCRWADKATQSNNQRRHWAPEEEEVTEDDDASL
jgi:hypothetical protein